jgi:alpha-L-rhamnosidase
VLQLIGTFYHDQSLLEQSKKIKETIVSQSFNGTFFIDNAIRNEHKKLIVTNNISEVCQYYAFFFDIANREDEKYSTVTHHMLHTFGPTRKKNNVMSEVAFANAFIGNYLRMEILPYGNLMISFVA